MSRVKNGLISGGAFLGGAAIGILAGVLLAPASGPETRRRMTRRIADEADALRRKGRQTFEDLSAAAADEIEHGKEKLAELIHS